eukprot:scaffold184_cov316-Pinguiococcus_pyrenoidosus.AAC.43
MTERIYNLLTDAGTTQEKGPMYRSKHDPETPLVGSTMAPPPSVRASAAAALEGTFGSRRIAGSGGFVEKKSSSLFPPQEWQRPDPKNFLRKHEAEKRVEKAAQPTQPTKKRRDYELSRPPPQPVIPPRPRAPAQNDRPIHGIHTEKNYIVGNAIEAILQAPAEPRVVEYNYLEKPDYGKVPKYLAKVREEVEQENKIIDEYIQERLGEQKAAKATLSELDELERQDLIKKLKAKWNTVNKRYQRMTHVVKLENFQKRRKETFETELSELEKQIATLSRTGTVFVQD